MRVLSKSKRLRRLSEGLLVHVLIDTKSYLREKIRINPFPLVLTVDSHPALEVDGKGILDS